MTDTLPHPAFPDKTPPINATGRYILREPFDNIVEPTDTYRCEAIDGFQVLELRGINVYNSFYAPKGISTSRYNEDKSAGINIVTIMSSTNTVHVPSSYIFSYPNQLDVPYGRIILSIDLGPLPSDFPLDDIISEMIQVGSTLTGNSGVSGHKHYIPIPTIVDFATAGNLASSRTDVIKDNINIYGSKLLGEEEMAKINTKVNGLEDLLKTKLGFG